MLFLVRFCWKVLPFYVLMLPRFLQIPQHACIRYETMRVFLRDPHNFNDKLNIGFYLGHRALYTSWSVWFFDPFSNILSGWFTAILVSTKWSWLSCLYVFKYREGHFFRYDKLQIFVKFDQMWMSWTFLNLEIFLYHLMLLVYWQLQTDLVDLYDINYLLKMFVVYGTN